MFSPLGARESNPGSPPLGGVFAVTPTPSRSWRRSVLRRPDSPCASVIACGFEKLDLGQGEGSVATERTRSRRCRVISVCESPPRLLEIVEREGEKNLEGVGPSRIDGQDRQCQVER
jgi:hypothetical protein